MSMSPLKHTQPQQEDVKLREVYVKLRAVFSLEQLEQLEQACASLSRIAIDRRAQMRLVIVFSDKGFPFVMEVTESVRFAKPGTAFHENVRPEV